MMKHADANAARTDRESPGAHVDPTASESAANKSVPLKAATALDVWMSAETEETSMTKRKRLVSFVCALPSSAAAPPPSETTAT